MNATRNEEWRSVVGHEGSYEVSSLGRVRSLDRMVPSAHGSERIARGRVLKPGQVRGRHQYVNLGKGNSQYVHALVASAFLGAKPVGLEICHNDGDATNNSVENLRYDTHQGNYMDMFVHGTHPQASKTSCPQGHSYTSFRTKKNGWKHRVCLTCKREQTRAARANGATW